MASEPPPPGGTTKPVPYAPPGHDTKGVEAQGYIVAGFSADAPDSIDVPRVVVEDAATARGRIGDRAGEDKWMPRREGVSAWTDVFVGFVLLDAIVATTATWGLARLGAVNAFAIGAGAIVGLAVALGAFHDRWRCVEAIASRYVRGPASHVWVPWIACVYGVWRGLKKLGGK